MTQTSAWGKVTSTSPLRVQLDGDPEPLPITPVSLIDPALLNVDDMVFCERPARKVFIIGRAQGDGGGGFIGEHRAGEWATPPHPAWVLADGAVLDIADYPKLAAHYAATYGASNHHGGDGVTTFAVPDTRERTYVNQGGSDVFAGIGAVTGAKTHTLTATEVPATRVITSNAGGTLEWRATSGDYDYAPTGPYKQLLPLGASTGLRVDGGGQAHNNVQPSFVARYIIRAA